ncbi:Nop domain-containing protein [Dacryopinax primogenitus]|uniref:Nucleolar protein 58 n=1 Tax=Dacryopinax primogenitus (strain DJM 731) TaxID=1858805 RepID=M5GBT5_DACPD|nr:Nop domain-containing protein [Dacryopinax primogenitus]EJU06454.1 Nop domain-containing protein [Dacryopinax primogenitus]
MLVLFETSLGFCLFKLNNDAKLDQPDLWKEFETPEKANAFLRFKALHRFDSTATAVEHLSAAQESKLSKGLKKFLTEEVVNKAKGKETLVVADSKLAGTISKKLGIQVQSGDSSLDLDRGIREQLVSLLDGLTQDDLQSFSLGVGHSMSRYKLKFSPDKVDTMVVQAIALLDELDKEINHYSMRVKEWYGWHFPEMAKIITDNLAYAKVVRTVGMRTNAATTSLAEILPEDLEATVRVAADISMGTEISESDIAHIHLLCDQVISMTEYRAQLSEYLRNRMNAIAPNLTALVGELVGARLISHAGSLLSLAKQPASTVQILGAEKALFRALKTKHDTPKYGLIYHASLIGQAPQKLKGKMARMVATKTALSVRVDALTEVEAKGEPMAASIGITNRAKLESRLRALEYKSGLTSARAAVDPQSSARKQAPFTMSGNGATYNTAADSVVLPTQRDPQAKAQQAANEVASELAEEVELKKKEKKEKKEKKRKMSEAFDAAAETNIPAEANGDVGMADHVGETEEECKERKRLRKEKRKSEKLGGAEESPAKAAPPAPPTTPALNGEGEKKKKRRASEAAGLTGADEGGERKKKKKRMTEAA